MPFIEKSSITNDIINQGNIAVASAQRSLDPLINVTLPPKNNGISQALTTISSSLKTGVSGIDQLLSKNVNANTLTSAAGRVLGQNTVSSIESTIRSITSTFDQGSGLAKTISGSLQNIFNNTNLKSASTTNTLISDAVSTNLLAKAPPKSSAFKVDSLESGSQAVGISGSSKFGSTALSMVGTQLSTLLNRFDIDSIINLPKAITDNQSLNQVKGLFSNPTSVLSSLSNNSNLTGSILGDSLLSQGQTRLSFLNNSKISPIINEISSIKDIFNSVDNSTINAISSFQGHSANLSTSLGNVDLSNYFVQDDDYSLVDSDGDYVDTNKSGVDAVTANAIRQLITVAGCTLLNDTYYESASERSSLFRVGLTAASLNGMRNEVLSLLGCSQAASPLGQQSLITAFTASSNSNLDIASDILARISFPGQLNNKTITRSLITNNNLKKDDVSKLEDIFSGIGTTVDKVLTDNPASSTRYPVYDMETISQMSPPIVDAVFTDTTFTNYLDGVFMKTKADGSLGLI